MLPYAEFTNIVQDTTWNWNAYCAMIFINEAGLLVYKRGQSGCDTEAGRIDTAIKYIEGRDLLGHFKAS